MKRKLLCWIGAALCGSLLWALPVSAQTVSSLTDDGAVSVEIASDVATDELVGEMIDAPTEVKWGNNFSISWKPSEKGLGQYRVVLYKEDGTNVAETTWYLSATTNSIFTTSLSSSFAEKMETGKYYFGVTAVDNNNKPISEETKSELISYTKPSYRIPAPTDLKWNTSSGEWKIDADAKYAGGIEYQIEVKDSDSDDWRWAAHVSYNRDGNAMTSTSFKGDISKTGIYRFKVRIQSKNLLEALDSDWSEWSAEMKYDAMVSEIDKGLDQLVNDNASADQVADFLDKQDKSDLQTAIQTESTTRDKIKAAEDKFKTEKGITVDSNVSDDMADKIKGNISMVGAAFNTDEGNKNLTLNVTKPTIEKTVDKNVLQNVVQVDLKLDGCSRTDNLKVPIRITMPIPAGINKNNIQILHYHGDGSYEAIWPSVEGDFLSFTVTRFSIFAFGNKPANNDIVLPFTDLKANAWYTDAVKYVYANKIMAGTTDTTFEPMTNCNRAMMVTILHTVDGKPEVEGTTPFTDLKSNWYKKPVLWAYTKGVAKGKSDTTFDPTANVTRQEVAAFLYAYAKYKNYDISATTDVSKFSDASSIANWALTQIKWANANGIINGKGNGILDPKGNANRAEVATMIMSFKNKFK